MREVNSSTLTASVYMYKSLSQNFLRIVITYDNYVHVFETESHGIAKTVLKFMVIFLGNLRGMSQHARHMYFEKQIKVTIVWVEFSKNLKFQRNVMLVLLLDSGTFLRPP